MLPTRTLVLGGAASGKSAFAEKLIEDSGLAPVYLATSQVFDDEMQLKINLHKTRRGPEWQLIEAPLEITDALRSVATDRVVLLDCATMWLTNWLMAERDMGQAPAAFADALGTCKAPIVIVSNEVGQGIVPDNAMSRSFREAQGRLNIDIAARADCVVHIVAGLPNVLKGTLP